MLAGRFSARALVVAPLVALLALASAPTPAWAAPPSKARRRRARRGRRAAKKKGAAKKVVRVGVLADGALKPEWARLMRRLQKEAKLVLGSSRPVEFPDDKRLSADWDSGKVKAHADALLADKDVDIILVAGFLGAIELAKRRKLPKPVLVPLALAPRLFGMPLDAKKKVSGKRNFSYLAYPNAMLEDLRTFQRIFPAKHVHVVVDAVAMRTAGAAAMKRKGRVERAAKVKLTVVPVGTKADAALAALPKSATAVYITPLARMSEAERKLLIAGLNARRVATFSMTGRAEVERGVLATQARGIDMLRAARRTAINIERVVRGEKPARFPVFLRRQRKLLINMKTARAVGYSPSWQVRTYAELYGEATKPGVKITLRQAVDEAIARSFELAAASRGIDAQKNSVNAAYAKLGPRLDFLFTHQTVRRELAKVSRGTQPWHQGKLAARVSQFVFIEPVLANITIQKHSRRALRHDRRTLELDVAAAAAKAFLNLLKARAGAVIRKSNALLTGENLEAAQVRRQVGVSGPSDLFRWQSQLASDRNRLIQARTQVKVAAIQLNRLMRRPQGRALAPVDLAKSDPTIVTREKELVPFLENPIRFGIFSDFLTEEGLRNSPEVKRINAALAAQKRLHLSRRRALWMPQLQLNGEVSYVPYRSFVDAGPITIPIAGGVEIPFELNPGPRFAWYVGLGLSLPLFTAFEQTYQREQQHMEVRKLEQQRAAIKLQIEQRVRATLALARAARAGIYFAKRAAMAAAKNFKVMQDGYARGVVNTILLLDAQNQAVLTKIASATALYDYYLSLIDVQRAVGSFEMFRTNAAREAWFERLRKFYDARKNRR